MQSVIQRSPGEYLPKEGFPNQQVDPQMKISIMTIMRDYLKTCLNDDLLKEMIEKSIHSRDELLHKTAKEYVTDIMRKSIDEGLMKKISDFADYAMLENEKRVRRMEDTVQELRRHGMPDYYVQQIINLEKRIEVQREEHQKITNKINYLMEHKFVEEVTDEEIRRLYAESELGLKNIADFFGFQLPHASRMINGNTKDSRQRHKLKLFLQNAIQAKAERKTNA